MEKFDVVVLGAGPTGLGAATRLNQLGKNDWLLLEGKDKAGGLACSEITPEGFIFDMGGHVIFSHYDYFDELIDAACGEKSWESHQRVSYVRIKERWVEYPFQNNLYNLPIDDQIECISGVIDAAKARYDDKPTTFDEWILRVLGKGIADTFMRPYNFKVWAYPTTDMQCEWLGERVATVDAKKVISNVLKKQPDVGWGPNATFRFPQQEGTGGIWINVAKLLPQDKIRYNSYVSNIDVENRILTLENDKKIQYNKLLSTAPLDKVLEMANQPTEGLHYSSTHIIGIGFRGQNPHDTKCWLYFPEDNCPFYRATVFSHYAESNVPTKDKKLKTIRLAGNPQELNGEPEEGPYWSLMMEISESVKKPLPPGSIMEHTIRGLINTSMCKESDEIVSTYYCGLKQGYPTPHLERDDALNAGLPYLRKRNIWSRGRFGSWKYEVANQDHSLMLGVEAVDNMLYGAPESTLHHPNMVNTRKNAELHYTKEKIDIK